MRSFFSGFQNPDSGGLKGINMGPWPLASRVTLQLHSSPVSVNSRKTSTVHMPHATFHSHQHGPKPHNSSNTNIQPEKQLIFPCSSPLKRSPPKAQAAHQQRERKRYPREHAPKRPCRTAARCCSWTASGRSPSPSAATDSLYSPSTRYAPQPRDAIHVPSLFWDRSRLASDPTGLNLLVTLDWKGFVRAWVNVWQGGWFVDLGVRSKSWEDG